MLSDFESRLRAFAEVIVRVGLNLQRGQRLLIAEPYELQGVARSAEIIVEAVSAAAAQAGGAGVEVIWGDGARLREYALNKDWRRFVRLVGDNARRMQAYLQNQDALLFLQGSQPHLLAGIPAAQVAELRRIGWEHFGPVAQKLVHGATNWTVAPAPSPGWAHAVFGDLPTEQRLAALWETVFAACRVSDPYVGGSLSPDTISSGHEAPPTTETALVAWQTHIATLAQHRDDLNSRRLRKVRYQGEGTDLTMKLPPEHRWCTAQLSTKSGVPFVANLPTEEVFTLPHRDSAEGCVRVARPVVYGGATIEGIELTFERGRVTAAAARSNADLLQRLLETDEGASRLGEVAIGGAALRRDESRDKPAPTVQINPASSPPTTWQNSARLFHHPLLDENVSNHIALGEAYDFCLREPNSSAVNRSLIHVDLPLNATASLS